jgi:hypothetical protein
MVNAPQPNQPSKQYGFALVGGAKGGFLLALKSELLRTCLVMKMVIGLGMMP